MSVNRPTNVAQKEKDINTKLQLYGIFSAFSNGKVPSNKQIDIAMNSFLNSRQLAKPSNKLSEEGRALIADVRDVIDKAKVLLLVKNEGNLLQDFIWQCQVSGTGSASSPNAPVSKDKAKQQGQQALDGLRTLGTLIVSNGQFRKLLNDMQILARDIMGDAAQNAANKVNPTDEELDQIDEPEDDDTWHDTPDVGKQVGDLKSQAKQIAPSGGQQPSKQDAKQGLKKAAQDARESGNQQGGSIMDKAKAAASAGMSSARGQAQENVDDEDQDQAREQAEQAKQKAREKKEQAKDKVREKREQTKGYLKDKVPEERREQTIYRLKKMIVEIQGHPEYQRAIDTLLSLAEQYQGHAKDMASQTIGATQTAHKTEGGITAAQDDLKILIERFANYTSTDDFFDSINQFYRDADRDPELKGWFKHVDVYIRKCLKEKGYVMQDSATTEWNKIQEQGDFLFKDRYKNHTQRFIDESQFLGEQFDKDRENTAFAESVQKLFNDLGTDEQGNSTFKPHLVKDLFNVIIPDLFESARYIPIPRIEYSDPMADAIVENLVIESNNLTPNLVEWGNENHVRWARAGIPSKMKNKVLLGVSGIQMDLKDVAYYVHKKHGFPSVEDTGVMDIFLGGSGFSFKIAMETADDSDKQHFFKIGKIEVDVKNMNIKLKQSKFKFWFTLVKPLLLKVMVPVLTKVIEKVIRDKVTQLDGFIYSIYEEGQRASKEAMKNPDPEHLQNMYQTYFNAFKTKLEEYQEKTKDKSANTAVNVAVTKQDSMFKNVSLPGGISTKATEYKELAAKGKAWESPVFSIGSARESTNLPKPQPIKKRPHQTAPSKIRGPKNIGKGMDAYSKADESDVFQQGDKYGQTGDYGGQKGDHRDPAQYSNAGYDGQQDYSQSAGGYGNDQYGQTGSDQYAQYGQSGTYSQGYGQDTYGSTGLAKTSDYPATNGNTGDYSSQYSSSQQYPTSQQYPAGYTPATSGYENQGYGDAYTTTGSTRQVTGAAAGGRGTTLGTHNPVLSGRV